MMMGPAPAPPLTDEQAALVREMWLRGEPQDVIARTVGRSKSSLFDRSRAARGRGHLAHWSLEHLPRRRGQNGGRRKGDDFDGVHVTPEEQAARTAEVQSWWDEATRAARRYPGPPEDRRVSNSRRGWDNFEPARGVVRCGDLTGRHDPRNNW